MVCKDARLNTTPEPCDGLSLRDLTRRFGARVAVDGVSLDARRGEVFCLLGPSGCGKSTTLRIAAGLERADSGRVYASGRLVDGEGRFEPPEKRRIGLMFQDYALFPHLSVKANVAFGLKHLSAAERDSRVVEELTRVGMLSHKDAYPHTLSGGEQQRVALARMLAPKPGVVLLDEPFSGLDTSLRDEVRGAALRLLKEAGAATIMVTHDPDEAMRVGDQVALMRAGRIVQAGTPTEIYRKPADAEAAALFGGANVFRAVVSHGKALSPFGYMIPAALPDGESADIVYRPSSVRVGETGISAQVLAIRPFAGRLEVEAAIAPSDLPQGLKAPMLVRAAAPADAAILRGDKVNLTARAEDALVFPSRGDFRPG
jgi:iron(III) transport system ATP-binding protein